MTRKPAEIYQIKITLDGAKPPIWRRILVPGNTTLLKLHDILQIVMGWEDYHLHMFRINDLVFGNPEDDEYGDLGTFDEKRYKVSRVIQQAGQRFHYEYDFGDSWEHTLVVEKILPPEEGVRYPICLKGKRACPPEDVGGVWGYEHLLEALRDPKHDEHDEYLAWAGEDFDPEAFDLEEINRKLKSVGRSGKTRPEFTQSAGEDDLFEEPSIPASPWPQPLPDDQQAVAATLPLRRDMLALLIYLRDNKVIGTQSSGNLPLKAVREICSRFVNPPILDTTSGDRVSRVRSEAEVWPLYFLHTLAAAGGLIDGGASRRWKLTALGENYMDAPAPLQVWMLLAIWWVQSDWTIASPYAFTGNHLPVGFRRSALECLLALHTGEATPFDAFAEQMIKDLGLVWSSEDEVAAGVILKSLVERVVADPMVDFGILQATYAPHKILGEDFPSLSTIQLTAFGRSCLDALERAIEGI